MKTPMKRLKIYQVDAFAARLFTGNPAAVVPLQEWLSDETMQAIAAENNLAETAFFVPTSTGYHLRWFTPAVEVKLCGHATLATAHVLFSNDLVQEDDVTFDSLSGPLTVTRQGDLLEMDFPADLVQPIDTDPEVLAMLGLAQGKCFRGSTDIMVVIDAETTLLSLQPDHGRLKHLDARGIIVTAPGGQYDFVSRFFGAPVGIDEDPVTGSAHTTLTPYWANRLGKQQMNARQVSPRGGDVRCTLAGDRVRLAGKAVTYLNGEIYL